MAALAGLLFAAGWVWTLAIALQRSALATMLCLFLPLFAQGYYCLEEPKMRLPSAILLLGVVVGLTHEFSN